jgi:hypothetical protein
MSLQESVDNYSPVTLPVTTPKTTRDVKDHTMALPIGNGLVTADEDEYFCAAEGLACPCLLP